MEQIKQQLIEAAIAYQKADKELEIACSDQFDPIASTVFAYKGQHLQSIPKESLDAAHWLREVVKLSEILIKEYLVNSDEVRKIWFPILNQ